MFPYPDIIIACIFIALGVGSFLFHVKKLAHVRKTHTQAMAEIIDFTGLSEYRRAIIEYTHRAEVHRMDIKATNIMKAGDRIKIFVAENDSYKITRVGKGALASGAILISFGLVFLVLPFL
ncbi:MAG: hypothetical protein FWG87_09955 [Defluviitaleaceae bacterium]|nr:hypothetical protein [Defluviitaleaceae bacterium]